MLVWKIIFFGHCDIDSETLFNFLPVTGTRDHQYKLYVQRADLGIRCRLFSFKIEIVWNSLPAETVCAQSLDTFKLLFHRDREEKLFKFC